MAQVAANRRLPTRIKTTGPVHRWICHVPVDRKGDQAVWIQRSTFQLDVSKTSATIAVRQGQITQVEAVHLFKDQLYVEGNQPWNLVNLVDVSQPSPPLEHTVQQAQAMDQQD